MTRFLQAFNCILLCVMTTSLSYASPFMSVGESVDIFLRGEFTSRYESNIFLDSSNKEDDLIFTFTPGVEFDIGQDSIYNVNLLIEQDIDFYTDNSDLNEFRENVVLTGSYDSGGITSIDLLASFNSFSSNSPFDNVASALIRSRQYNFIIGAEFALSSKSTLTAGFDWAETDYRNFTDSFNDSDSYSVNLGYYYQISEKLRIGPGYRFRFTDLSPIAAGAVTRDRSDHFVSFRVDGEIAPKLTTTSSVGFQTRHVNGLDSESSLSIASGVNWDITEKLKLSGSLSRDFSTSGIGATIESTSGSMTIEYQVLTKLSTTLTAGYTFSDYSQSSREDETFSSSWSWFYSLNDFFRVGATYQYSNNDTNTTGAGFNNHVVRLNVTAKY